MPLYRYECLKCGTETEVLVRGDESVACSACQSTKLRKQVGRVAALRAGASEPAGCGAPSCCRMTGDGCMN